MSFATVWDERVGSRQAQIGRSDPSAKLELYGVQSAPFDDDTDANLSLLESIPLVYPGFLYVALTFKGYEIANQGGGLWYASVTYTRQDPLFCFDTGGGTQKITQALAQRGVYGPSGARTALPVETTSGSGNVFVLGTGTTAGLNTGDLVSDSQGAFAGGTVISTVTDSTHLALSNAASKTTGNPKTLQCTYNTGSSTMVVVPVTTTLSCAISTGSVDVAVNAPDDTSGLFVGAAVSGPGIPFGATVASIPDGESFTLSIPATDNGLTELDAQTGLTANDVRVGVSASGVGMAAGVTVSSKPDAFHIVLTSPPTADSPGLGNPITFSEEEILFFAPATQADRPPDFKGAINVKDDSVEGVDVEIPAYHWEETYHVNPAIMTLAYRNTVGLMTGSMNSDPFRGLDPGEVKFMGARGSQKGSEDFEITFRFAASPNRSNFKVGDITVPFKYGWDYMWVRYKKSVDSDANVMRDIPAYAVVDQVSPAAPFSALGIGS
jgi:hypothetical protein